MSFTLATLKSTVQDYCETAETTFVSDLDTFIKKSPKLGLLQFSNIKFDENFRPVGRKSLNKFNNTNNIDLARYLKHVFNRKDKVKIEFEIFNTDIEVSPKLIIENLKNEILSLY